MLNVKNINQYYGGSHILRDVSLQAELGKVSEGVQATLGAYNRPWR